MKVYRLLALAIFGIGLTLSACTEKKGPMERAGENVDRSIESAGEKIEEVGENIEDSARGE